MGLGVTRLRAMHPVKERTSSFRRIGIMSIRTSVLTTVRHNTPRFAGIVSAFHQIHGYVFPSHARREKKRLADISKYLLITSDKAKKTMWAAQLARQEKDFLRDIWQHPGSPVVERYRRLSFSVSRGNELQGSLVHRDFVSSCFVDLPRGRMKALTLTDKGKKVLGISSDKSDPQGDPEHR